MYLNRKRLMISYVLILLMGLSTILRGQTKDDLYTLRYVALQALYQPSNEYQTYLDYYAKSNAPEAQAFQVKAQLLRGQYSEAVQRLGILGRKTNPSQPEHVFAYHFLAYQISHVLGIESEAKVHAQKLSVLFPKVKKTLAAELAADFSAFDFLSPNERRNYLNGVLKLYQNQKNPVQICLVEYFLGQQLLADHRYSEALANFENSSSTAVKNQLGETLAVYGQLGVGEVGIARKEYRKALEILEKEATTVQNAPDYFLKAHFFREYTFLASRADVSANPRLSGMPFYTLIHENDSRLIKARSLLVNSIDQHFQEEKNARAVSWKRAYYGLFAFTILLILGVFAYRKYRKTLQDQEKPEEVFPKTDAEQKVFNIPDKTEKDILEKLDEFEASGKFTKANMSLKLLSGQLNTNPRYLSEIINKHKDSNFNSYINGLRIDYILKKLNEEPDYRKYKVSYLGEECGFSSHSLFTTTFKNKVGVSPIEYIKNLEK